MSQGEGDGETVTVDRNADFAAFNELPQSIRDIMNYMPLHHSATEVRALLMRTPADVVEVVLRREAGRVMAASERRIRLNAKADPHAAPSAPQRAVACAG